MKRKKQCLTVQPKTKRDSNYMPRKNTVCVCAHYYYLLKKKQRSWQKNVAC